METDPECGEVGRALRTLRDAGVDSAAKFDELVSYIELHRVESVGQVVRCEECGLVLSEIADRLQSFEENMLPAEGYQDSWDDLGVADVVGGE